MTLIKVDSNFTQCVNRNNHFSILSHSGISFESHSKINFQVALKKCKENVSLYTLNSTLLYNVTIFYCLRCFIVYITVHMVPSWIITFCCCVWYIHFVQNCHYYFHFFSYILMQTITLFQIVYYIFYLC